MRGYRLFPDISSVAVEWRIGGFRIRTMLILFTFAGAFAGGAALLASAWVGVPIIALTAFASFCAAVYIYKNDPNLVLGELTLISVLLNGTRNRYISNETKED